MKRPPILSDENVFVQLKEKSRYARSYFKMFNKSHDFEVSHPGEESIIFQSSGERERNGYVINLDNPFLFEQRDVY